MVIVGALSRAQQVRMKRTGAECEEYYLVKSPQQSCKRHRDTFHHCILETSCHEVKLVFIRHIDVGSTLDQLHLKKSPTNSHRMHAKFHEKDSRATSTLHLSSNLVAKANWT